MFKLKNGFCTPLLGVLRCMFISGLLGLYRFTKGLRFLNINLGCNNYSALLVTMRKNLPRCCLQHRSFPLVVDDNAEKLSAVMPKDRKTMPASAYLFRVVV